MKRKIGTVLVTLLAAAACLVGCASEVTTSDTGAKTSARLVKVQSIEGDASVVKNGEEIAPYKGMVLDAGDTASTGSGAEMTFALDSDKTITAHENTVLKVHAAGTIDKGAVNVELVEGSVTSSIDRKLSPDSVYEVNTPNATMSVRGTVFTVTYTEQEDRTVTSVERGKVAILVDGVEVALVEAGEYAEIANDEVQVFTNDEASAVTGTDEDSNGMQYTKDIEVVNYDKIRQCRENGYYAELADEDFVFKGTLDGDYIGAYNGHIEVYRESTMEYIGYLYIVPNVSNKEAWPDGFTYSYAYHLNNDNTNPLESCFEYAYTESNGMRFVIRFYIENENHPGKSEDEIYAMMKDVVEDIGNVKVTAEQEAVLRDTGRYKIKEN